MQEEEPSEPFSGAVEYEEEEEDAWDPELNSIIRAKWCIDGCSSLASVAERLREVADGYERMAADGWELTGRVDDDYGFVRRALILVLPVPLHTVLMRAPLQILRLMMQDQATIAFRVSNCVAAKGARATGRVAAVRLAAEPDVQSSMARFPGQMAMQQCCGTALQLRQLGQAGHPL